MTDPRPAPPAPTEGDPRISAPAALRNRDAILAQVSRLAPGEGRALELASGSGEHVIAFAPATPGLTWQPSDPDPAKRASIAAWIAECPAPNILPPVDLDAASAGWSTRHGPVDLIVMVNLLHLIPDTAADTVLREIATALAPGGVALIYGPFLRDGQATSEGDAAFHARLQVENPGGGYKDVADVVGKLVRAGLTLIETVRMPANNLLLALERLET